MTKPDCEDCCHEWGGNNGEPPCEKCYIEPGTETVEVWNLYLLCRNQVRVAPMGEVIGLDYGAVIELLKLYRHGKQMFENIMFCWRIERESQK